jgi:hypothetical protein
MLSTTVLMSLSNPLLGITVEKLTDQSNRRCCERLGDQCFIKVHHVQTGNGIWNRL